MGTAYLRSALRISFGSDFRRYDTRVARTLDTRRLFRLLRIQAYLGHRNIQNTTLYGPGAGSVQGILAGVALYLARNDPLHASGGPSLSAFKSWRLRTANGLNCSAANPRSGKQSVN
jgi:hypothetical protein